MFGTGQRSDPRQRVRPRCFRLVCPLFLACFTAPSSGSQRQAERESRRYHTAIGFCQWPENSSHTTPARRGVHGATNTLSESGGIPTRAATMLGAPYDLPPKRHFSQGTGLAPAGRKPVRHCANAKKDKPLREGHSFPVRSAPLQDRDRRRAPGVKLGGGDEPEPRPFRYPFPRPKWLKAKRRKVIILAREGRAYAGALHGWLPLASAYKALHVRKIYRPGA